MNKREEKKNKRNHLVFIYIYINIDVYILSPCWGQRGSECIVSAWSRSFPGRVCDLTLP